MKIFNLLKEENVLFHAILILDCIKRRRRAEFITPVSRLILRIHIPHIEMAFVFASLIYLSSCEASQEILRGDSQSLGRRASLYCKNDNYFGFVSDGKTRNCQWVRDAPEDTRQELCRRSDVRTKVRFGF